MIFSKYRKIALMMGTYAVGGVVSGCITVYYFYGNQYRKWDSNWDRGALPSMEQMETRDRKRTEKQQVQSEAARHVIFVRHGQYFTRAKTPEEKKLTALGEKQALATGQRLAELNLPYTRLIRSTMVRATQTAELVHKFLPNVPMSHCSLLEEGAPYKPEPYNGWPSERNIYVDGPRIEGAFRKYIYRAPPEQKEDSCDILVCHANVIRYIVCRALQLPPSAWYRLRLNNGSITWLTVYPNGEVVLHTYSDAGYMPPDYVTTS